MSQQAVWEYRTVEVNRSPGGESVVIGDSVGSPKASGRVDVPVALYLSELGKLGWEVCGAFGHVGENDGHPEATIILKKQG